MTGHHELRRSRITVLAAFLAALCTPVSLDGADGRSKPGTPVKQSRQSIEERSSGLPLLFEPNLGQTDPQVRFLTRASGITAFLTARENVMVLSRRKNAGKTGILDRGKPPETEQTVVRMRLEGASQTGIFEGLEKTASVSNYFIGNDPSKWVTKVPNYRKLAVQGIYPGIDLVYYGDGRKLEYDFVVHPAADPSRIDITYAGADALTVSPDGDLLIATRLGTVLQQKPRVYQEIGGRRREIGAGYSVRGGKVQFALANWDRKRDLIIDPVIVYSTYLGGSAVDAGGSGLGVGTDGSVYVTGGTTSPNFPTLNAAQPALRANSTTAFVTKLNPTGTAVVYSTYFGGTGTELTSSIAIDANTNAYLAVQTNSTDYPVTPGAYQTAFPGGANSVGVTKFGPSGTLLYSHCCPRQVLTA